MVETLSGEPIVMKGPPHKPHVFRRADRVARLAAYALTVAILVSMLGQAVQGVSDKHQSSSPNTVSVTTKTGVERSAADARMTPLQTC